MRSNDECFAMVNRTGSATIAHSTGLLDEHYLDIDVVISISTTGTYSSIVAIETKHANEIQYLVLPDRDRLRVCKMIARALNGKHLTQRSPPLRSLNWLANLTHPLYHPAFLDPWFFTEPIEEQPVQPP